MLSNLYSSYRQIFVIAVLANFFIFFIASCDNKSNNPFVGTWAGTTKEYNDCEELTQAAMSNPALQGLINCDDETIASAKNLVIDMREENKFSRRIVSLLDIVDCPYVSDIIQSGFYNYRDNKLYETIQDVKIFLYPNRENCQRQEYLYEKQESSVEHDYQFIDDNTLMLRFKDIKENILFVRSIDLFKELLEKEE